MRPLPGERFTVARDGCLFANAAGLRTELPQGTRLETLGRCRLGSRLPGWCFRTASGEELELLMVARGVPDGSYLRPE